MVFMVVGPHSGFSLDEILDMKRLEEDKLGYFFWGYGGSLCHPSRVQRFATEMRAHYGEAPVLVMAETTSKYRSKTVGRLKRFSVDGISYQKLPRWVTLIGCTMAVTCKGLRRIKASMDLNLYRIADGIRSGMPLGKYLRFQLNKACAVKSLVREERIAPRVVDVIAAAELVPPYSVYLAE